MMIRVLSQYIQRILKPELAQTLFSGTVYIYIYIRLLSGSNRLGRIMLYIEVVLV
jgi:hypothetical protein